MRIINVVLGAVILAGCSPTEPSPERVLGTIAGFSEGDPHVTVSTDGTAATVVVRTYGNGCFSVAATEVELEGLGATVLPYDHDPGCPQRDLLLLEHATTIEFGTPGAAVIRVKGLDASNLSSANLTPDTLVVERTVELQ